MLDLGQGSRLLVNKLGRDNDMRFTFWVARIRGGR